jgi:hypothetical protein
MEPLPGARVAVIGTTALTDTDELGRFDLPGVPVGTHRVSFYHDRLQTLGVSAPSLQVDLEEGATVFVQLAVPSERTLLISWCLAEQLGAGYGAVAGVVTDSLTGVPLSGALVTATVSERRFGDPSPSEVRADDSGFYRVCSVPAGREVTLQAHFGQNSGRSVVLSVEERDGHIQDLMLLMSAEGTLAGSVLDYVSGGPLEGAVVSVLGTAARSLTDPEGEFALSGIPPGRHLVVTEFLGYEQRTDSVTIFSQETVDIEVRMAEEALELEGLVVTARTRFGRTSIATDKRADVITRAEIEPILHRVTSMGSLLRNMNTPGLRIAEVQVADATGVIVPGLCVEIGRRTTRTQGGCSQAAVIVNGIIMPFPDQILMSLDPGSIERIEILSPIDAQFQYGTSAGSNGALLIFTR